MIFIENLVLILMVMGLAALITAAVCIIVSAFE